MLKCQMFWKGQELQNKLQKPKIKFNTEGTGRAVGVI